MLKLETWLKFKIQCPNVNLQVLLSSLHLILLSSELILWKTVINNKSSGNLVREHRIFVLALKWFTPYLHNKSRVSSSVFFHWCHLLCFGVVDIFISLRHAGLWTGCLDKLNYVNHSPRPCNEAAAAHAPLFCAPLFSSGMCSHLKGAQGSACTPTHSAGPWYTLRVCQGRGGALWA